MPSRNIADCVPILQQAWEYASKEWASRYPNAPQPILTCTYRSEAEQEELYAQGRTKPGPIVTQLKSGSKHNSKPSEAFDIAFKTKEGKLDWIGTNFSLFEGIIRTKYPQVEWGGSWKKFKDAPHFQV
jgi:peptidoglycan L-alanyl-D-glutamate endopeptidase CwlK